MKENRSNGEDILSYFCKIRQLFNRCSPDGKPEDCIWEMITGNIAVMQVGTYVASKTNLEEHQHKITKIENDLSLPS